MYKCYICNKLYKCIGKHVKSCHNIEPKEYYDKFIKKENEGICKFCGKNTEFVKISKGYREYCCKKHFYQSELVKEHRKDTVLERFNVENCFQSEICKNKIKETNLKRYGVESPLQSETIKKQVKNTCLEKYGVENTFQVEKFKEKTKNTMYEKYSCYYNMQSAKIRSKAQTRYVYNNIKFDSSSELTFYIWCIDHNINIKRNYDSFTYTVDNIEHKYFPDFIIDGQYYEIKGEHMITTDNNILLDPHTHKTNKILEMKMKCIKENNIKIIKSKELYNCIKYINQTYGKNYIKQFKNTVN